MVSDAVRSAVRHKQWRTAAPILKALTSFGTSAVSALDTVRPLAEVEDVETRTAAASAIWKLERRPESVVPLLQRLLGSKRNFEAINLAGRIGPPAAAMLPRLRQMLNEQLERNALNKQNDSTVLNGSWTLVPCCVSALGHRRGRRGARRRVGLLTAWKDNDSTARHAVACLNRMAPAAHLALPRIEAVLAQPRRGGNPWGWDVAVDLEIQHSCQSILTRLEASRAIA